MSDKEASFGQPVNITGVTAVSGASFNEPVGMSEVAAPSGISSSNISPPTVVTVPICRSQYDSTSTINYMPMLSIDYSMGRNIDDISYSSNSVKLTNGSLSQSNYVSSATEDLSVNTTANCSAQTGQFAIMMNAHGTPVIPSQNVHLPHPLDDLPQNSSHGVGLSNAQTFASSRKTTSTTSKSSLSRPYTFPTMVNLPSVSVTSMSAALSSLTQPLNLPSMLTNVSTTTLYDVPLSSHASLSSLFSTPSISKTESTLPSLSSNLPSLSSTLPSSSSTLASISSTLSSLTSTLPSLSQSLPSLSQSLPSLSQPLPSLSQSLPFSNLLKAAASATRLETRQRPQDIGTGEGLQALLEVGETATLNTQQGQSFNVVIMGDAQNRMPSLFPFGGFGISQALRSNTPGIFPSNYPQGTYFLAVTPSSSMAESRRDLTSDSVSTENSSEKDNTQMTATVDSVSSNTSCVITNTKSVITKAPPRPKKSKLTTKATGKVPGDGEYIIESVTPTQDEQTVHQLTTILPRDDAVIEKQKYHKLIKLGWEGRVLPSTDAEAVYDAPKRTAAAGSTREKRHACTECEKSYYTSSHLKAHMRTHTGERPYICDVCQKSYHRPEALSAHRRLHLGIKRFECEICGKKYGYYSHLNVHVKRVHKKLRPYACEVCGKGFTMMNNLRYHMKIHSDEKPHKCDRCGRGFVYPSDLQRHIRGHTGDRKFKCDKCGKGFIESGSVARHKKTVHERHNEPGEVVLQVGYNPAETQPTVRPDTLYTCGKCGKTFAKERQLSFHRRIHHEDGKIYPCSHCERTFGSLRCARAHENRMHLLNRDKKTTYECDFCGESFQSKRKLIAHRTNHYKLDDDSRVSDISQCLTEQGTYKCSICNREFDFPGGLIIHRLSHSNFKPYSCSKCGQAYRVKRSLTSHEAKCQGNNNGPDGTAKQKEEKPQKLKKEEKPKKLQNGTIPQKLQKGEITQKLQKGKKLDKLHHNTMTTEMSDTNKEALVGMDITNSTELITQLHQLTDQTTSTDTISQNNISSSAGSKQNTGKEIGGQKPIKRRLKSKGTQAQLKVQQSADNSSPTVETNSNVTEVVIAQKEAEHDYAPPLKKAFYINLESVKKQLDEVIPHPVSAKVMKLLSDNQNDNLAEVLAVFSLQSQSEQNSVSLKLNPEEQNSTLTSTALHESPSVKEHSLSDNEDGILVTPRSQRDNIHSGKEMWN